MMIEFHRNMLADHRRNQAFYDALKKVIVPGQTTLADIGAGTGLLSFMAIGLGAKAAYLYEYSEALRLAQKLARQNKVPRCHFIHEHSANVEKPVKVDVVISETLGNYAFEENLLETIEDARRFLKPGGTIIPQRVEQFVAPVTSGRFHQELRVWKDVGYGLDFSTALDMTLNNLYVRRIEPSDLMDQANSAQRWDQVDLREYNDSIRRRRNKWVLKNDQTIDGFALWWDCELVDGVSLSTSPHAPLTHWEQLYLPLLEPLTLGAGSTLEIALESDTRYEVGVNLAWTVTATTASGDKLPKQVLNMKKGRID